MIATVSIELSPGLETPYDRLEILDSEVRDPAAGVIGHVLGHARINWRAGRRYLEMTVDIDDVAAVAAATRNNTVF